MAFPPSRDAPATLTRFVQLRRRPRIRGPLTVSRVGPTARRAKIVSSGSGARRPEFHESEFEASLPREGMVGWSALTLDKHAGVT